MKALRQSFRQKRRNITPFKRKKFSKQLSSQAQKTIRFYKNQKVALYLPNDGEINPIHLKKLLNTLKIITYLPKLTNKSLKFAKIGNKFKKNKFGINEPIGTQTLNAQNMDIIFIPLVAFDKNKNRLGMGGGFYDRTLEFKKNQSKLKKPKLYGLAFDCQQVKKIKTQSWDIVLDAIITPSKIY